MYISQSGTQSCSHNLQNSDKPNVFGDKTIRAHTHTHTHTHTIGHFFQQSIACGNTATNTDTREDETRKANLAIEPTQFRCLHFFFECPLSQVLRVDFLGLQHKHDVQHCHSHFANNVWIVVEIPPGFQPSTQVESVAQQFMYEHARSTMSIFLPKEKIYFT